MNLNRLSRYRAGLSAALLLSLALAGCSIGSAQKTEKPAVQPISVAVTEVRTGRLTATHVASGQIEPILAVGVTSKVSGRIAALYKEMGDAVAAGTLLAVIEAQDISAQVAQAQAAVSQAEAQRQEAQRQYDRLADLLKSGAVSRQQVEQLQTQVSLATAQVEAARAALNLAYSYQQQTRITAPADGVISYRGVEPGVLIGTATVLFQVVDLSTVIVRTGVAEREVNQVHVGEKVPVTVPALGRIFTGTVEAVSPNMDRQTRTYQVRVSVPNPDSVLKGGMFAQVRFPVQEREGVLVPVGAIIERGGEPFVYIVTGDTAHRQKVTIDVRADDMAAVSGIEPGAQVVTAGHNRLYDGAPVRVGRSAAP